MDWATNQKRKDNLLPRPPETTWFNFPTLYRAQHIAEYTGEDSVTETALYLILILTFISLLRVGVIVHATCVEV